MLGSLLSQHYRKFFVPSSRRGSTDQTSITPSSLQTATATAIDTGARAKDSRATSFNDHSPCLHDEINCSHCHSRTLVSFQSRFEEPPLLCPPSTHDSQFTVAVPSPRSSQIAVPTLLLSQLHLR
ncbi:hypothetical protein HN51_013130 [Arachis hypogaea]